MIEPCISCRRDTAVTDEYGFPWCPNCYGNGVYDGILLVRELEKYLQRWAEYREWEAKEVIARILTYTREDR